MKQQRRPFVKKGPPRHGFQDEISGMTQEDLDRILTGAALPKETTTQSNIGAGELLVIQFIA